MTSPQDPAEPQNPDATSATDSSSSDTATPVGPPAERPRPAFGEYAPEGWTWQAPGEAEQAASGQDPAAPGAPAGARTEVPAPQYGAIVPGSPAAAARPAGSAQTAVPPTVAGVPHNLGVGQQRPGTPQHFAAPANTAPGNLGAQLGGQPGAAPYGAVTPPKNRTADRVVTILLLAVGALGALNVAASFMTLPQSFGMIATAFKISDWVAPASLTTIGTVGTLVMLAFYAIMLIYSVQRMRRRKLAFFIPLIGGVVAFIVMFVIIAIAMAQAPELFANLTPERMQQLLDSLTVPTS